MPQEPHLTNLYVLVKIISYNYLLLLRLLSLKAFPVTVAHMSMSDNCCWFIQHFVSFQFLVHYFTRGYVAYSIYLYTCLAFIFQMSVAI